MFDSELRRLADAGSAEHQWQLSLAYRDNKQAGRANRYYQRALAQGYPEAVKQQLTEWIATPGEYANFAAARELLGEHPSLESLDSWRWQLQVTVGELSCGDEAAATWELLCEGYTSALRYAALRCAMAGHEAQAIGLLRRASDLGDDLAERTLHAEMPGMAACAGASNSVQDVSAAQLQTIFETPLERERTQLAANPVVTVSRAWLMPLACRMLAALAEPELQPSLTYEPSTGRQIQSPLRTSYSMTFMPWLVDPSVAWLQRLLAEFCDIRPFQCEVLGLLRYQPDQAYQLHYDAFAESQASADVVLQDGGQRIRTALIYLNEEYVGGETRMEKLDIDVKGATGDLLIFDNVDGQGIRHPDSLHAGKPVVSGTKWLLSQWYRQHETIYTRQMDWRETGSGE